MQDHSTNLAIQILEQKISEIREECDAQVRELQANISRLGGQVQPEEGTRVQFTDAHSREYPAVRPGQYRGMNRKSALQAYLNERPGRVLVTKAAKDLMEGGAPMGKDPKRYRRYLRTTITANKRDFDYNESSDTVSLVHQPQRAQRQTA